MNNELEQFRQVFAEKSDDELVRMFDDADTVYLPKQIKIITDEVERRNIQLEPEDSDFEAEPKKEVSQAEINQAEINQADKKLFILLAIVSGLLINFLMDFHLKMVMGQRIGMAIGGTLVWMVISGVIAFIYKLMTRNNQWQYVFVIVFIIVVVISTLGNILGITKS